jgi:hypothetical protein
MSQLPICHRFLEMLSERQLPTEFDFSKLTPTMGNRLRNRMDPLSKAHVSTWHGIYTARSSAPDGGLFDLKIKLIHKLKGPLPFKHPDTQQKWQTVFTALSLVVSNPTTSFQSAFGNVRESLKSYIAQPLQKSIAFELHPAMQHIFYFLNEADAKQCAAAGGLIGAMALACLIRDTVAPAECAILQKQQNMLSREPQGLDELLERLRDIIAKHAPKKFRLKVYRRYTGRDLENDLKSLGICVNWTAFFKAYRHRLYPNQK